MWDEMWPSLCTCLGINFKRSIRNSEIMFHPQKGVVKHSLPCEFATLRASIHEPFTGLNLRKVFRLNYMKDGIWGDFCQADLGPLNWEISPSTHRQLIFEKVKQEFHRSELRYNFLKLKVCHRVTPPKKKTLHSFFLWLLKMSVGDLHFAQHLRRGQASNSQELRLMVKGLVGGLRTLLLSFALLFAVPRLEESWGKSTLIEAYSWKVSS